MLPPFLPRLLAFDLDGTLLPDGGTEASPATLQALKELRTLGCQVAIITGRERLPLGLAEAVQPDAVATSNGGYIEIGGTLHHQVTFNEAELTAVLTHELGAARVVAFSAHTVFVDLPAGDALPEWLRGRPHRPLAEAQGHEILKINFYHPEVARWRDQLQEGWGHLVYTGAQPPYDHFMTVTPQGADKGAALSILAHELNIPLSEVMAFGDSDNDLAMLLVAGFGVQVGQLPLLTGRAHAQVPTQTELGSYLASLAAQCQSHSAP